MEKAGRSYYRRHLACAQAGTTVMPARRLGMVIIQLCYHGFGKGLEMSDVSPEMKLTAIGTVKNKIKKAPEGNWWGELVSDLVIEPDLTDALAGIDGFSHIIVLFWMHLLDRPATRLQIHPMGRPEIPLTGIFATRTPSRPNPIGMTVVRLLERRANVLKVDGLDAIDGSPVIDIKPYIPVADLMPGAKAPEWIPKQR